MIDIKETIKDALSKFWTGYQKNVVDSLDSQSSTLPLSANMGYELNAKIYPVGSIFIWSDMNSNNNTKLSNIPDLSTPDKMSAYFGGTWILINNKFLMGGLASNPQTGTPTGATGGNKTVTLSADNLPSHRHTIPALSGKAEEAGGHSHYLRGYGKTLQNGGTVGYRIGEGGGEKANNIVVPDGAHTHIVTTTANNTGSVGSGKEFSVLPPYVVVCIYQRVA